MGAGDWVTGGLRRAVSGVRAARPGQAEPQPPEETGAVLVATGDQAVQPAPDAKAAPASKPVASKPVAKAEAKADPPRRPAAKKPAEKPVAKGAPAKAATKAPVPAQSISAEPAAAEPVEVPVPTWSDTELDAFRTALEADIVRLREELNMGEADMADLLADSSDGAGDDQADAGSKTLEREQEMSVTANARDLLDQSTHARRRLEAGTYGICESCATVIPAARLRAFPRATLCIACKQAEERR
jgi:RNA polymerase-binding transcription factor DksA